MERVCVNEMFCSIQGESTYAGLTCFFLRLTGCNLRCRYCDSTYAFEGGEEREVGDLVSAARASRAAVIQVTGGEPLLQPGCAGLSAALRDDVPGRPVLVETNGSLDISRIPAGVVAVMDVKTPSSGESSRFDGANVGRLRPYDEVKFVLCGRSDYEWAASFVERHGLIGRCGAVLFSPAWGMLSARDLAGWILEDRLPVRLQVQLHKLLDFR